MPENHSFDLADYGGSRVVAVILARDEGLSIEAVVEGALARAHEVVVMDGHSKDETVQRAQASGARVVLDSGRGKGAAIREAIDTIEADVIVFLDADGSHDTRDISRLALPVIHDEADLCVGSRFTGGSDELSVDIGQLVRTIGNISMNIAINKRWRTAMTDTLNGFRAARRDAIRQIGLREDSHTIEQEMVMKMLRYRYRVLNVSAHEFAREHGTSHICIWREWPKFVWCLIVNLIARDKQLSPPRA